MTLNAVVDLRDGVAWTHAAYPAIDSLRVWAEANGTLSPVSTLKPNRELARSVWSGWSTGPRNAELLDALGTLEPKRRLPWINRHGFTVLPLDERGGPRVPFFPGYRRWGAEREANETEVLIGPDGTARTSTSNPPWLGPLRWTAVAGGSLHGKRITIDPDGGVDAPNGVGPSGTRGAHASMRVARILRGFLEAAGAEVLLTRDADVAVSDVERVRVSEAFGTDRFLRIAHRAEPPRLAHYPGSSGGNAWAKRTADAMGRLGFAKPAIGEDAQYPLQQTSCPALYVGLAQIDDAASEEALFEPGALRASAYALYVALAREWAHESRWDVDSLEIRDEAGQPVEGAAVWLGGSLMLESDTSGTVRFVRTEPGPIEVAVHDSRVEASMILLDSMRGAVVTGPPGR
jgi:N-acetylmuramoyl-L-alanine amidase